ncbi:MAG TPA: hypothetical protein VHF86_09605 [Xanthomonadaceae bacterium]|jgi:uncharacterized low-complexity protein|nr:hypothetical protein [Xanthomonadaceae bacterium]
MSSKSGSKALIASATLAGGLMLAGSAFAMNDLGSGYMLSPGGGEKTAEGKCGEGKCGVDKMDTDKDGKVSKAEFAAAHEGKDEQFGAHDPNGDGFIDAEEFKAHKDKAKMEGKCGEGKCGGSA